jgi:N-methylhydantoinase A/oxoprolinase/acetone carboxylase beta subunit
VQLGGTLIKLIPRHPGLFSSFGLLTANIEHHAVSSIIQSLAELDVDALNRKLAKLGDSVRSELRSLGFPMDKLVVDRLAELKFDDRSGEIVLPLPPHTRRGDDIDQLEKGLFLKRTTSVVSEITQATLRRSQKGSDVYLSI